MSITITQNKEKDIKIHYGKEVSDTVNTEGFKIYTDYISNLRSEAMYHVLAVDVESIRWRERLRTLDEILDIPNVIIRKSKISQMNEEENG